MDRAALEQVRSASTAYTKGGTGKKGPWESYFSEMCKKAVIKRARKTWPYTDPNGKMALAVDLANRAEGGYTFDAGGGETTEADDANLTPITMPRWAGTPNRSSSSRTASRTMTCRPRSRSGARSRRSTNSRCGSRRARAAVSRPRNAG